MASHSNTYAAKYLKIYACKHYLINTYTLKYMTITIQLNCERAFQSQPRVWFGCLLDAMPTAGGYMGVPNNPTPAVTMGKVIKT